MASPIHELAHSSEMKLSSPLAKRSRGGSVSRRDIKVRSLITWRCTVEEDVLSCTTSLEENVFLTVTQIMNNLFLNITLGVIQHIRWTWWFLHDSCNSWAVFTWLYCAYCKSLNVVLCMGCNFCAINTEKQLNIFCMPVNLCGKAIIF